MEPPYLTDDEQSLLLEQLGDVFLTEDRRQARRDEPADPPEDPPEDPHAGQTVNEPTKPAHAATDHPLEGPAPIRLRPKVQGAAPAKPLPRPGGEEESSAKREARSEQPHHPGDAFTADSGERAAGRETTGDPRPTARGQPPTARSEPPTAQAELVLLGNLPGLAGPWLTQYAQLIAEEDGPVAIVRADDEAIDVELVEPRDASLSAAAAFTRFVAGHNGRLEPVTLLDALVRREPQPVRNVLVLGDTATDADTIRRYLVARDWTVLTGHDDAAVVAAYAAIKRMAEAVPEVTSRHVGLMVMGCDEASARQAASKVAQTAAPLLDHPLRWLGHHKRMVPVQQRQLGSFPADAEAWDALTAWLESLVPPVEETPAPYATRAEADSVAGHEPAASSEAREASSKATSRAQADAEPHTARPLQRPGGMSGASSETQEAKSVAHQAKHETRGSASGEPPRRSIAHGQPVENPPPHTPRTQSPPHASADATEEPHSDEAAGIHTPPPQAHEPPPTSSREPSQTVASRPKDLTPGTPASAYEPVHDAPPLCELLTGERGVLPDAIALDARCPDHPEAELLLDGEGVIHVLARHRQQAAGRDADVDAAILTLMQIRRWAHRHRELLQLTRRQLRFDPQARPRVHLFTDRADLATPIAAELGDEVTLHLLQRVTVGEASAWFCTPLTAAPGGAAENARSGRNTSGPPDAKRGVVTAQARS